MNHSRLLWNHLFRVWKRHWALQIASVTVMTLVLMMLNFLLLGYSAFNKTMDQLGQRLEMTVYLKETINENSVSEVERKIRDSGDFDEVHYVGKSDATKRFLTALGPESLELLSDPKWSSPIPASLEIRLSERIATDRRLSTLQSWDARLRGFGAVEDVFYGQGWVENFSAFARSARGVVALFWLLCLCVGLLIVSNCIRLSFLQRRNEIEILELVGATSSFIRRPFLLEGLALGLVASILSLSVSYVLHQVILTWLGKIWNFWFVLQSLSPLQPSYLVLNFFTGLVFGGLGAWNCVRSLNTGWSAAAGS